MSLSDPIADMLTRIRNAIAANHKTVNIPYSKIKEKLAQIAQGENISLNKLIIRCIDFALKNR